MPKACADRIIMFCVIGLVAWAVIGLPTLNSFSRTSYQPTQAQATEHPANKTQAEEPWLTKDAAGFFTFLLVVVGGAQVGLFLWQLWLIRESLDDAKIAADAAKESADAAGIQARTAQNTLITMQDTARRELRAYVGISGGQLSFEIADGKIRPKAAIKIKNFGRTPAYDVGGKGGIRNAPRFTEALNEWMSLIPGKSSIFPDCDQWMMFFGEFNAVSGEDPIGIFVFGRITYKDAFGHKRWTNFRFTAHLDQSRWLNPIGAQADLAACEDGNDAN